MGEDDKALVETSRHFMALVATKDSLRNHGYNATAEIIGVVPRLLDRIEDLSAENERLREALGRVKGRLSADWQHDTLCLQHMVSAALEATHEALRERRDANDILD